MPICINKNSVEYQSLKDRAGISEFILESVCRDYLDRFGRMPYLDELPNSNSELYLKDVIKVKLNGGAKISDILEGTGRDTVEEAVIDINDLYRDLEVQILPIQEEAIVDIQHRPSEFNTDDMTEEELILSNAPRDEEGNLLAPNGKISNLTELQYAQVRTKAFKRWFGDWENFAKINNAVVIWGHPGTGKTWMFNNDNKDIIDFDSEYKVRLNKLAGLPEGASAKELRKAWRKENKRLYLDLINSLFDEAVKEAKRTGKKLLVSDLHLLTERINDIDVVTNISDLEFIKRSHERGEHDEDNKMLWKNDINQAIARVPKSKVITMSGRISDLIRGRNVSKVVDENGEPLVVYHYSPNQFDAFKEGREKKYGKNEFDENGYPLSEYNRPTGIFFSTDLQYASQYGDMSYPVFLNIKNPSTIKDISSTKIADYREQDEIYAHFNNVTKPDGYYGNDIVDRTWLGYRTSTGTEWVALSSNQIKSAIGNEGTFSRFNNNIYDKSSGLVFSTFISKLSNLYGIKINETTTEEVNSMNIPDADKVNAFIYNGLIYINVDNANVDAPIHEMFHILVGSMRFTNPLLYQNLINTVQNLPNYLALAELYLNRSRNDINEEIFVTEVSKYFSGMPSYIINLDEKSMYELTYNIKRTLDSILMGKDSVKSVPDERLYNMSLREVSDYVESHLSEAKYDGDINMEGSELHRKLNNIKSDLIKNKTLEEYCD